MKPVQQLIQAIQSCDCRKLREAIAELEQNREQETVDVEPINKAWAKRSLIDDRLTGLGLTALHVAAKAYSAHSQDPQLAQVFNDMVQDLLKAGANPFITIGARYRTRTVAVMNKIEGGEIGNFYGGKKIGETQEQVLVDPGLTVIEVCEGKVPPALAQWFVDNIDEINRAKVLHDQVEKHSTTKIREAAEKRRLKKTYDRGEKAHLALIKARMVRAGRFCEVGV